METRKLYYEDCHLKEFEALVISCIQTEKGFLVTLDATAFYPEGGGQACDLGSLDTAKVLDVQEQSGDIFHLCDTALPVGKKVLGRVDWARRLDLQQQHSGEHIVSGIIHSRFGYQNTGFHVGGDVMEVDFDGVISDLQLQEIETLANEIVWKNLPVQCGYPAEEELKNIPYRSKKQLAYPVRIVEIPDVDICACCGVHVKNTGEIGLIKLLSCTKLRQGIRIEMVCGGRALRWMQRIFQQNRQVSNAFSAPMLETGGAAMKMNEALAAEKLRANLLQTQLFQNTARTYSQKGNVLHFEENLTGGEIRRLAEEIFAVCGGISMVLSGTEGEYSLCILGHDEIIKPLCGALREKLGARGGGKSGSFQGTVAAHWAEIRALAAEFLDGFVENHQ